MGVTGLWTVVQPCARPIKIETLNKKRLAVDASIWIYQFLKAVRDKEGNALRNSHVVGFFRRICKLLFIGIKPVFVFDGGAPALKRQTISGRKARREGRREDAVRTAGKLLALQMQRRAEEEEAKRRRGDVQPDREEDEVPDNLVYADEITMTQAERDRNRKFKKKDQYHLPDLNVSLAEMGQPNDPRVMSLEELENYARQFDSGEDINVYDFSKIDFNSPFFQSLPAADRYNILNAARLRSRLRMGYSKDQLEEMFPDRMAFSRFQIERVKERNELTQRLMHLAGMTDDSMPGVDGAGRIAGERGREYVLVRNAGVEGGWALGVIGDKDSGERNKPIDVDKLDEKPKVEEEESEDDMGFEDVPIEGLNRLPKLPNRNLPVSKVSTADILRRREALYDSRSAAAGRRPVKKATANKTAPAATSSVEDQQLDSLFVQDNAAQQGSLDAGDDEEAADLERAIALSIANAGKAPAIENSDDDEDEETQLQKAMAMSLEQDEGASSPDEDDFEEVFQERRHEAVAPFKGTAGSVAKIANEASRKAGTVSGPFQMEDEDDSDEGELLATCSTRLARNDAQSEMKSPAASTNPVRKDTAAPKFDGPLPFEKLDLGSSILGKKKMKQIEESQAGGFEKPDDDGKKDAVPLPPWFNEDIEKGLEAQKLNEAEDRAMERRARAEKNFVFDAPPKLITKDTAEVIDVDADEQVGKEDAVIMIESDDEAEGVPSQPLMHEDEDIRMNDLAELSRAEPPTGDTSITADQSRSGERPASVTEPAKASRVPEAAYQTFPSHSIHESDEEQIEWEESDHEEAEMARNAAKKNISVPAGGSFEPRTSRSPSMEFEDVDMTGNDQVEASESARRSPSPFVDIDDAHPQVDDADDVDLPLAVENDDHATERQRITVDSDDEQFFSSDEDEELMFQLATEAEEHARFASQLNRNTSVRQSIEEYERELKSLRSQQKKDRRDADEVTQVMITECQQLLKLFGLPYITAPMEAEAQCAELVHLGLVDGIVTDDSDVFLFGGTRVYKNMFNQAKFVECYLQADFEREFDLTREKMIRIAHLLGSDYTEGLPGIGPVTALEIITEFPNGLGEFKEWWTKVQRGGSTVAEDGPSAFRRKFRRNTAKLFLPNTFPDIRVDDAYLKPEVDSDPSAFQWGLPDLDALRAFLMATIGWSQDRTDEVLVPVVRDMNRRMNEGTQANITSFLGGSVGAGAYAPRRRDGGKSKRMETALEKLAARAKAKRQGLIVDGLKTGPVDAGSIANGSDDVEQGEAPAKGKRKASGKSARKAIRVDDDSDGEHQPKQKRSRKGKRKAVPA